MKEQALANALAGVTALYYIVCAIWVLISPRSFAFVFQTWIHGIDISQLGLRVGPASLIFGFVTLTAAAWVFGYFLAWLYNQSK